MLTKTALAAAGLAIAAMVGYALATEGSAGLDVVTGSLWGRTVIADFYLGVLCFAAVIAAIERSAARTLAWTAAIAVLGNPVAVVWLLLRGLPALAARRTGSVDGGIAED